MMKLKVLDGLPRDDAQLLLSRAAFALLPNPKTAQDETIVSPDVVELMTEIREQLGIVPTDDSGPAVQKMITALGAELSARTLTEEAAARAKDRLARRLLLRPSQYRIEFQRGFGEHSPKVRRAQVEDAIRNADGFAHDISDQDLEAGAPDSYTALYSREMNRGERNAFVWLVYATVKGRVIDVMFAFKVPANERRDPRDPLEVLRGLAERFGITTDWGPFGVRNLIEHESTLDPNALRIFDVVLKREVARSGANISLSLICVFRQSPLGPTEVRWCFLLDAAKLDRAMQRLGVS